MRDPLRRNEQCRCMPRWQAFEKGSTRGGSGRVRGKGDFRHAEPGGPLFGTAATDGRRVRFPPSLQEASADDKAGHYA